MVLFLGGDRRWDLPRMRLFCDWFVGAGSRWPWGSAPPPPGSWWRLGGEAAGGKGQMPWALCGGILNFIPPDTWSLAWTHGLSTRKALQKHVMTTGCGTEKMTGQDFVSSQYEEKEGDSAKYYLYCLPQGYFLQYIMTTIKQGHNII